MTSKPVEIVVELLNEGMSDRGIKDQLVEMGLSGREVYRLMNDAKKLKRTGGRGHTKEDQEVIEKVKEEESRGERGDELREERKHRIVGHQLMQRKLENLKSAITRQVEENVTPQDLPNKPAIVQNEEKPETESSAEELSSEIGEDKADEAGKMLEQSEKILNGEVVPEIKEMTQEEEDEMNNEKLDKMSGDLEQIKNSLKVLEELNIKLVELLRKGETGL